MQNLLKFIQIIIILISIFYDVKAKKVCYEMLDDDINDGLISVGDMILTPEQYASLFGNSSSMRRHGLAGSFRRWPNGVVPVVFEDGFKHSFLKRIKSAMRYIMRHSCVVFDWTTKITKKQDHILVKSGNRCASLIGCVKKGAQNLILNSECHKGNIIHELLHALGLLHMHTAKDRDDWILIVWDNIKDEAKFNFKKYTKQVSMFDTSYDYGSIMHYGINSFSKDQSSPTIIPLKASKKEKLGQREKMSEGDIIRLNRMYECYKEDDDQTYYYDEDEMMVDDFSSF
ncbi:hypothetical protein PVAND_009359 [Polypedilum vanderplanki]|uniref:Metalloendopeptidase n=1 Tax=Polypedilum vanderplanki TaxID=319348 RepID=A0A9J6CD20_POLVA|nr:hypothetical protein PVAND_009359 [Polypedilum vanderplanki]